VSVEAAQPVPVRHELERSREVRLLPALAAFAPVFGLAAAQGGYFPTSWGWACVPLLWTVAVVVIVGKSVVLSTVERRFLLLLAGLTGWIGLSAAWSVAGDQTVLELERALVYLAAVSAVLFVSRRGSARSVLGGLLAAISLIATFSLLTRLVPDRIGVYDPNAVYRLSHPIGYWNGLGIFAGMGALLALGFAERARTLGARALCAGLLVVLLPTLYFTFGRAVWIALAAGLAVAVAVDPRRLQLLAGLFVLGPLPAIAVLAASRESGLTHAGTPLGRAAHDGHRLALLIVLLAVANAFLAVAFAYASRRIEVDFGGRAAFAVAVTLALIVGIAVVFNRYGGPVTLAKKGYTSFTAPPPHVSNNLNRRLLSFSGNGRADLWRLAWDDAKGHPVLGAGAGTYERYFLLHQPADVSRVRDAHGLYVETLAELGPIGLALLIAVFAVPLVTLRRARRHPLVPAAAGAYVAYLVHTGVDWDWELPAVTLAGLLCGASILLAMRRWRTAKPLSPSARFAVATIAVATAGFATIGLLGNAALSRSATARREGRFAPAAADARRARSLMPWSPAPWEALGETQLAAGLAADARRSFRKAISIDDRDWQLWYGLAGASTGAARRNALRRAVALYPRSGLLETSTTSRHPPKVR
jgi:O-Antigen ligase